MNGVEVPFQNTHIHAFSNRRGRASRIPPNLRRRAPRGTRITSPKQHAHSPASSPMLSAEKKLLANFRNCSSPSNGKRQTKKKRKVSITLLTFRRRRRGKTGAKGSGVASLGVGEGSSLFIISIRQYVCSGYANTEIRRMGSKKLKNIVQTERTSRSHWCVMH